MDSVPYNNKIFLNAPTITYNITVIHFTYISLHGGFPGAAIVKNPPANTGAVEDEGFIPGLEDPLEEEMATYSIILACIIPWIEKPGGLQSMGSQRVRHN